MSPKPPKFRFFFAALVVLTLFGLGHLAGHLQGPPEPASPDEATLLRLLAEVRRPPIDRTTKEIVEGFSLFLVCAPWALAAAGFALTPLSTRDPGLLRRITGIYLAFAAASTLISIRYWFFVPTGLLMLCAVLLALSLAFDGRRRDRRPDASSVPTSSSPSGAFE
jgi:hypothetical protein